MLTSVYNAHKNNNKNIDKRVISIAQLCLSTVQKIKILEKCYIIHTHHYLLSGRSVNIVDLHSY